MADTPTSRRERTFERLLLACASVSVATTLAIVLVLVIETLRFFAEVPLLRFVTDVEWRPRFAEPSFGIWPLVLGTCLTTVVALAVAAPLGLLSAVYLVEYASNRVRRILRPTLDLLAAVPTIVYGYFALAVINPFLQGIIPGLATYNPLSPGIAIGIMITPLVSSLGSDAIDAVPENLREAAYALGASRLATIVNVVLPGAATAIGGAVLLGVSRAMGETMIVAVAGGQQPRLSLDLRIPIETMTAFIVRAAEGDTPAGTLAYRTLFAVGTTLFLMTFTTNLIARRLMRRSRLA